MMVRVSEPGFYGGKYLRAGDILPEAEASEESKPQATGRKKSGKAAAGKPGQDNDGSSSE
ncbi:MAG: hypothetical protein CML29_17460 [Rhizobiales bacterium]|nr:hypothetical protein [Hyphomicrobiales bacterium]MBA68630.1 hypothetical protein [Hyphomicrobiales bacterium]|tara:strand:- start:460 stop:639 length:180 start_codon:yes stop_codon:yes gene_type:complete